MEYKNYWIWYNEKRKGFGVYTGSLGRVYDHFFKTEQEAKNAIDAEYDERLKSC
jgi:hypothetical protein